MIYRKPDDDSLEPPPAAFPFPPRMNPLRLMALAAAMDALPAPCDPTFHAGVALTLYAAE